LKPVGNAEPIVTVSKKRGRWDQQQGLPDENAVPIKKKATWDNAEVSSAVSS
jgi:hypothetical protein